MALEHGVVLIWFAFVCAKLDVLGIPEVGRVGNLLFLPVLAFARRKDVLTQSEKQFNQFYSRTGIKCRLIAPNDRVIDLDVQKTEEEVLFVSSLFSKP